MLQYLRFETTCRKFLNLFHIFLKVFEFFFSRLSQQVYVEISIRFENSRVVSEKNVKLALTLRNALVPYIYQIKSEIFSHNRTSCVSAFRKIQNRYIQFSEIYSNLKVALFWSTRHNYVSQVPAKIISTTLFHKYRFRNVAVKEKIWRFLFAI